MEQTALPSGSDFREGSTLYYSLLYTDKQARARVANTLNLIKVISTTLYEVSEPEVAQKKIHWWHEELERLAKREARHPACIGVQPFMHNPAAVNAFVQILSAAANERYSPTTTEQDLHDMVSADYSARLALVEQALTETPSVNQFPTTAFGLGQAHRLTTLATRLHHGYAVFSDEHYSKHETTPERLLSEPENRAKLVGSAVEQSGTVLNQALEEQHAAQLTHIGQLPMQIMTNIRRSQAQLWHKRKPDLLHEYITLTPVRKFFIAYRCKRRFAKL